MTPVVRRFRVTLKQPFPRNRVPQLQRGVRIEDELVAADAVFLRHSDNLGTSSELDIHVTHGRARGVRELFTTIGFDVKRLQCIQIGMLRLTGIPLRGVRELDSDDIEKLFRSE